MFERFTDRARRVVVLAQEEARMLGHDYIGSEHLLLGVIHEGGSAASEALESVGVSLDKARQQVGAAVGRAKRRPQSGHIPFTGPAKRALELSLREALERGHSDIGPEHILLGLIRDGEGTAVEVLTGLGAGVERVREQVAALLPARPQEAAAMPAAAGPVPARAGEGEYREILRRLDQVTARLAEIGLRLSGIERQLGAGGEGEAAGE